MEDIWPSLHTWARNYCIDNHITHCQLLTMCNLNSYCIYLEYLALEGYKRKVSYKKGSMGKKFIDSLQILKDKVDKNLHLIIPEPPSISTILYERYFDIHKELEKLGITSISIKSEIYPITIELFGFDFKINKQEAIEKFKQIDFPYANPDNILFTNVYCGC